jgi:hypothetical protein
MRALEASRSGQRLEPGFRVSFICALLLCSPVQLSLDTDRRRRHRHGPPKQHSPAMSSFFTPHSGGVSAMFSLTLSINIYI